MTVLAFTPTYGDALRPETAASIVGQRWAGQVVWVVGRCNPHPPPDLRNVFEQYRQGREMALAGGYDALWTVEHDMVLPPDALQQLWDVNAPVAYGVYMLRHGSNVLNAWECSSGRNLGMSLSLYPERLEQAKRQGVVEVSGVGFGCTLIRRDVLEQVAFRPDGKAKAPDIPFATDCLRAGIRQVAHFGVACGHVHEGKVLTMSDDSGRMVEAVALQDVTINVQGQTVRLVHGVSYAMPADEASELVRAGYVLVADASSPAVEQATDTGAAGREMAVGVAERKRRKA